MNMGRPFYFTYEITSYRDFLKKLDENNTQKEFNYTKTNIYLINKKVAIEDANDIITETNKRKKTNKAKTLAQHAPVNKYWYYFTGLIAFAAFATYNFNQNTNFVENAQMDNLDEGLHRHTNLGNKKSLAWKAETDNNTKSYEGYWFIKYFIGIPISFDKASQIDSLLTPWKNPGDCWAFKGSKGQAIITLQNPAKLSHVTMEHIVSDRNSAPYEHEVHGIRFNKSIWLGSYFYDKTGSNIQTNKLIHVEPEYLYKKVVLTIKSNHGNPDYTCVYRFRIHGFTE